MSTAISLVITAGETISATTVIEATTTVVTNSVAGALIAFQEKNLLGVFITNFLAIVLAGLIIAVFNSRILMRTQKQNQNFLEEQKQRDQTFLKEQKQRGVADLYFSNLEEQIVDYFKEGSKEKAKILGAKTYAYIESFMLFLSQKEEYAEIQKKLDEEISILLDLNDEDEYPTEEARLGRILKSLATIRYLIAK